MFGTIPDARAALLDCIRQQRDGCLLQLEALQSGRFQLFETTKEHGRRDITPEHISHIDRQPA